MKLVTIILLIVCASSGRPPGVFVKSSEGDLVHATPSRAAFQLEDDTLYVSVSARRDDGAVADSEIEIRVDLYLDRRSGAVVDGILSVRSGLTLCVVEGRFEDGQTLAVFSCGEDRMGIHGELAVSVVECLTSGHPESVSVLVKDIELVVNNATRDRVLHTLGLNHPP